MIDLSKTIEAKSDQLNADDLVGGPKILKITDIKAGSADQPIIINYEGDNGKPWKPSKGMRRVLVAAWGADGSAYIGRSVEVYRDASVKWAGQEVGGIRVSKMSDIKSTVVLSLTMTRGKKTPVTIKPLEVKKELSMSDRQEKTIELLKKAGVEVSTDIHETVMSCETTEQLKEVFETLTSKEENA